MWYFYRTMPLGAEPFAHFVETLIAIRKIMKAPIDPRHSRGAITEFRIPAKVRIGDWHEVTAVYKGSVKSGYFNLMIQDRDGIKHWFKDNNSVDDKLLDSGVHIQTGRLNFSNGQYESNWKFRPERPLYSGYAKAVICMFEDTKEYPLVLQEKDIHLI